MSNEEKEEKDENIKDNNNSIDFELIYSDDQKKIKEMDNYKILEYSTNISEGIIKNIQQSKYSEISEFKLKNDKNHELNNSIIINKEYISLDSKNYFRKNDFDKSEEAIKKYKIKSEKNNISKKFEEISNVIKKKLLNSLFPGQKQDFFTISFQIMKKLDDFELLEKKFIEINLNYFFRNQKYFIDQKILLIDLKFIKNLGGILGHIYKRLKNYKIKDQYSFLYNLDKSIEEKVNVKSELDNYIEKENIGADKLKFFKKIRKKYNILPELIYLTNLFQSINIIIFDINIPMKNIDRFNKNYFILCILNIPHIIKNINYIKFSNFDETMFKVIYQTKEESLMKQKLFYSYKKNKKNKIIANKEKLNFNEEDTFLSNYKLIDIKNKSSNIKSIFDRQSLQPCSCKEIGNILDSKNSIVKEWDIIKVEEENNDSTMENSNQNKEIPRFNNDEVVCKFFDILIIALLSLGNYKNLENLELILIDSFYSEISSYFMKILDIQVDNFHILNLIYNQLVKLNRLNLEINSLDLITFNEILKILYNSNASDIKLSLFTFDFIYSSPYLYRTYRQNIKRKMIKINEENIKGKFNEEFFKSLHHHFTKNLNNLFEILKHKKLNSLSLNFNIPSQILNDDKYILVIIKFIMNIFIFFFENENLETKELSVLAPSLIINGEKYIFMDEFLQNNNIKNKHLLKLDIRLKFFNIRNIHKFISHNLKILNIGDLDRNSLKYFIKNITEYKFVRNSSLQQISIKLNNTIQKLDEEIKLLFAQLFNIFIQGLVIYLYTNIEINLEEYQIIIDLLQHNLIHTYFLAFNNKSKDILKHNYSLTEIIEGIFPRASGNIFDKINEDETKQSANYAEISFLLKYLINKCDKSKKIDFYKQKRIIYNIFSYLYETQRPCVNFYEKES